MSTLASNPSHLKELHLNDNVIGDSGLKQISTLLRNPDCKLQRLGLKSCSITEAGSTALASALSSNPSSHLIELDLDNNKLGDSGVKQISTLLRNPCCKLQTLGLKSCSITEEGCAALTSALTSNPSRLIQMDLDNNKLGDSGVKQISTLLRNPDCKLQTLGLSDCGVTGEGYAALATALKSNPLHLEELDLRLLVVEVCLNGGARMSSDLRDVQLRQGKKPVTSSNRAHGRLERSKVSECTSLSLRFEDLELLSDEAERACEYLTSVLGGNPLLLTELFLSGKIPGDSGVKQFCALLGDSHCRFKILRLVI
ncbi:NACHT, LRR and PYD domains-containing protein 12-like [Engraulis encrasicolus]|uniref:NACHT, LRR and PYD domains-containing protein 12-like n=1 Tax=Engraulis encrasicolus TaxID=184585 RepID=UPI002FCEAB6E